MIYIQIFYIGSLRYPNATHYLLKIIFVKLELHFLFILTLISACQPMIEDDSDDNGMISIPIPAEADGYWNVMDYFSDYKIIPLETTESSLIRRIKKVILLEDKIIVFDDFGKRSIAEMVSKTPLDELIAMLQVNGDSYSGMPHNFVEYEDKLFFSYTFDLTNEGAMFQFGVFDKDTDAISVFEGLRIPDAGLTFQKLQFKISEEKALAFVNPLDLDENGDSDAFLEDYPDVKESDNPVLILLSK